MDSGRHRTDAQSMLFAATLMIALASILVTQVAHRRARGRAVPEGSRWQNSPFVLFTPVALVIVGLMLVAAVGASKAVAVAFFLAAFATALVWTVRTAR